MYRRVTTLLPWLLLGVVVPVVLLAVSPRVLLAVGPGLLFLPLFGSFLFLPMRWVCFAVVGTLIAQVALVFGRHVAYRWPMDSRMVISTFVLFSAVYGGIAALVLAYRHRIRRTMTQLSGRHDESISELAGGVAHDLSNLLTVALGTARIMEHSGQLSDELRTDLDTVTDTVRSSTSFVKELAGLFAGRDLASGPVEINALLAKTAKYVQPSLPAAIDMQVAPGPKALHVRGNYMQLQRCLLNLFINARDAIDGAGVIEFRAAQYVVEPSQAVRRGVASGHYVVITVTDTGRGMSARTVFRAFRPLFSTKRTRGIGMGLAIVDEIAHRMGGFVEVNSRAGQGSRFDVYLPLAPEPESVPVPDEQEAEAHAVSLAAGE